MNDEISNTERQYAGQENTSMTGMTETGIMYYVDVQALGCRQDNWMTKAAF